MGAGGWAHRLIGSCCTKVKEGAAKLMVGLDLLPRL